VDELLSPSGREEGGWSPFSLPLLDVLLPGTVGERLFSSLSRDGFSSSFLEVAIGADLLS